MNLKHLIVTAVMAALSLGAWAQKGINNPMTQAVLKVYDQQLQEDPTDWETWMARANEYYSHSEYLRALNDVDNALKYIPESRKDDRVAAYLLRANIYTETERYNDAIQDYNAVTALNPNNYVAIYQRANAHYNLGQYKDATVDYKRLQRLNPRSVEALVGLARIAVKENNLGTANELLDQAVNLDPNNAEYYVRRASVRKSMGNDSGAVEDLILALSTDSHNTRATQALVDYGDSNYAAVMAGLTNAMEQAPRVEMFIYLRAIIAQAHYNYKAALQDLRRIIDQQLSNYQGLYASIAECEYALGQYNEALADVDRAIAVDPNTAPYQILKSKILRALDRPAEAFDVALKASVVNPGGSEALVEMGLCRADQKQWQEAADLFAEAMMNNPEDVNAIMLRAWVLGTYLNQPVAASGFYGQVMDQPSDDMRTLKGFAMLFDGREAEGTAWIDNILSNSDDKDGRLNYLGACFYAQAGNFDRALECATRSLNAGYANYHDWNRNTDGRINVAPLRDDLRFLNLLSRNSHLFE